MNKQEGKKVFPPKNPTHFHPPARRNWKVRALCRQLKVMLPWKQPAENHQQAGVGWGLGRGRIEGCGIQRKRPVREIQAWRRERKTHKRQNEIDGVGEEREMVRIRDRYTASFFKRLFTVEINVGPQENTLRSFSYKDLNPQWNAQTMGHLDLQHASCVLHREIYFSVNFDVLIKTN